VGVSSDCKNFWSTPFISGTGKATNFKLGCSEKNFCARINRIGLQKMTNTVLRENVKILTLYSNGK